MQVNIGILGLGTVGGGVWELLERNLLTIAQRAGCELNVVRVATKNPQKPRNFEFDPAKVTGDVGAVLDDPDIHIVAELIGGVEPAREYILRALRSGKAVVTANKELIAKHGPELAEAAEGAGVDLLYEASVGGGIPLIKPLRESLAANRIQELLGIVNGTTNYILTQMAREGRGFDEVLEEAQRLGYAESDPSADVDGFDAAYKLVILANVAFGTHVSPHDVYREGIRHVSAQDIEYAAGLGYVIKLVALGRRDPCGELELRVHPALLPREHPLAKVDDAFNAVLVNGDAVGDVMFYGRGAGAGPTASAVVGDLIEVAHRINDQSVAWGSRAPLQSTPLKDFAEIETRFCVRMQVVDKPGALARIADVFGDKGVSLESIVQRKSDGQTAEIFWMTHRTSQRAMARSLSDFNLLEAVHEVSTVLRVEGE
jgi:homoserine dehydrogenase